MNQLRPVGCRLGGSDDGHLPWLYSIINVGTCECIQFLRYISGIQTGDWNIYCTVSVQDKKNNCDQNDLCQFFQGSHLHSLFDKSPEKTGIHFHQSSFVFGSLAIIAFSYFRSMTLHPQFSPSLPLSNDALIQKRPARAGPHLFLKLKKTSETWQS